jgi:predicted dehydrogenase
VKTDDHNSRILSRVLICGLGSIGRRHLRLLRLHWPSLDIAVLRSGIGPDWHEIELANHIFCSLDEAITWGPEAAIIATPATDHLKKALPLATHGVPLLIEKPVGSGQERWRDWQELLKLSETVPISIGYVLRHDPCMVFIREQLVMGTLGTIVEADLYCGSWLPDWRPGVDYRKTVSARRDHGGGALLELSHELDLCQWLFGSLRLDSALLQQSGLLEVDVEDHALVVAHTVDSICVTMRLNFCTQPPRRYMIMRGNFGQLCWDVIGGRVEVSLRDNVEPQLFESPISADDRYYLQMKHFLACAMGQVDPMCSLAEGLKTVELIIQARQKSSGAQT